MWTLIAAWAFVGLALVMIDVLTFSRYNLKRRKGDIR
jgi:hypothetical protein